MDVIISERDGSSHSAAKVNSPACGISMFCPDGWVAGSEEGGCTTSSDAPVVCASIRGSLNSSRSTTTVPTGAETQLRQR